MDDRVKAKLAVITTVPTGNDVIISYDPEDKNYVIKIRGKYREDNIIMLRGVQYSLFGKFHLYVQCERSKCIIIHILSD